MTQQEKPADGSTHWTTRSLAERFNVGKDTVARIWSDHKVRRGRAALHQAKSATDN